MTWYAITISPSSMHISKHIRLQRGPRGGLKRIAMYDDAFFQIERDLAAEGFNSFVPSETKIIRDRKNGGHILKRFPMLRGYAFVKNPHDWMALTGIAGVQGVLGSGNTPLRIQDADIAVMRLAQEDSRQQRQQEQSALAARHKRLTRTAARAALPRGMQIEIDHPQLGIRLATVESATGRGTVKAIAEFLGGLVTVEVPVESVRMVA